LLSTAQEKRTGVWRGFLTLKMETYQGVNNIRYLKTPDPKARPIFFSANLLNRGVEPLQPNELDTKAKIEFQQVNDKMLAVLTSYSDDNSKIICYQFNVWPTPKEMYQYHLQGIGVIMNTSGKRAADLFDMRGSFVNTDSGKIFIGIWHAPRGNMRFGSFAVGLTTEQVTINPELFYQFIEKNKIDEKTIPAANFPAISAISDSIVTNASFIHGSLVDNGLKDQDTLSFWLNGKLLEDNIVPGKKPYPFRIPLTEGNWNHFTIRCKSEGKTRGAGVHVSMEVMGQFMKYNLAFYKNHQADWVIGREKQTSRTLNR
jgi:hypothetical protein